MAGSPPRRIAAALFASVLAATACAGGTGSAADGPAPVGADEAARPGAAESDRLEAIYRARADSARLNFTEADVRFMTGMIGHHAQAVVMSRLAPERGASRSVQTLAARIINAQRDEISRMQRWLEDRGQQVPEVHIDGTELTVHGPSHAMDAPGMLTDEQIRELASARGREFDRLFLTYMIQHHRGAVVMVDDLFAHDGAAQDGAVFQLASDIHVDQTTEIARMESMLESLPTAEVGT